MKYFLSLGFLVTQLQAASMFPLAINAGGYITRVVFDPNSTSTCWVGSDIGGLFKGTSGCQSFSMKNESFSRSDHYGIDDILVDKGSSSIIYVLGGEYSDSSASVSNSAAVYGHGFWKSTDGGATFSSVGPAYYLTAVNTTTGAGTYSSSPSTYIRNDGRRSERLTIGGVEGQRQVADGKRIAYDPGTCSSSSTGCTTLYVADFSKGVFKSEDAGATFYQLPLPPQLANPTSPTSSSAAMRVSSIELIPYTSGGSTSYLILVGTRQAHQSALSTAPIQGQLYLGFNGGENALDWITLTPSSLTSGATFEVRDISLTKSIDVGSISSSDAFFVAAGKGGVLKATFSALSTSAKTATLTWSQPSTSCSSSSWSGTFGVGLSCDSALSHDTQTGTYVAVEADPTDSTGNKLYTLGLAQGSIFYSSDGGTNWSSVYNSSTLNYNSSWFDQHYWKFGDFATSLAYRKTATPQIIMTDWWSTWKATANGSTSFYAYNNGIRNLVFNDILNDPYSSSRVYAAVSDHTFFYSTGTMLSAVTFAGAGYCSPYNSTTASCQRSGIDTGQGVGVALAASTDQKNASNLAKYVFLATKRTDGASAGNLYVSEDNGATWTSILPASFTSGNPAAILYDKNFSGLWLAWADETSGASFYKLTLSGSTWSATSVSDVITDFGGTSTEYFTHATKLFKSSATSTTLYILDQENGIVALDTTSLTSSKIPTTGVTSKLCANNGTTSGTVCDLLSIAVNSSGTIFVGTKGGGVFESADSGASWTQLSSGDAKFMHRNVRSISIHPSDTTGNTMIFAGDADVSDHWSAHYYSTCTCTATTCTSGSAVCTVPGIFYTTDGGSSFTDIEDLSCTSSSADPTSNWGHNINFAFQSTKNKYHYFFGTAGQGGYVLNLSTLKTYCSMGIPF